MNSDDTRDMTWHDTQPFPPGSQIILILSFTFFKRINKKNKQKCVLKNLII